MTFVNEQGLYPEGCDTTGLDCSECVGTTARSMRAITQGMTSEAAAKMFQRMYVHAACRPMEHQFVWSCLQEEAGYRKAPQRFVQIAAA